MVLPPDLMPFAENIYRRFPEEFMALGMPGLEQIFDLRVEGSRSRRISETPNEKTVEITIRRWQPPSVPPCHPSYNPYGASQALAPQMGGYGVQPGYGAQPPQMGGYGGGWPSFAPRATSMPAGFPLQAGVSSATMNGDPRSHGLAGYGMQPLQPPPQQSAPPATSAAEAEMTSHLARLEATLSSIMPQIQAAARAQAATEGGVTPLSGSRSPSSPLRIRRQMGGLSIAPPPKPGQVQVEEPAAAHVQASAVKQLPAADSRIQQQIPAAAQRLSSTDSSNQKDSRKGREPAKERPQIIPVRMVQNAEDPESPRSPGRYSAWR